MFVSRVESRPGRQSGTAPQYSPCGLWAHSIDNTHGLVRNAEPQDPLSTYLLRICILTRSPRDVCVLSVGSNLPQVGVTGRLVQGGQADICPFLGSWEKKVTSIKVTDLCL